MSSEPNKGSITYRAANRLIDASSEASIINAAENLYKSLKAKENMSEEEKEMTRAIERYREGQSR